MCWILLHLWHNGSTAGDLGHTGERRAWELRSTKQAVLLVVHAHPAVGAAAGRLGGTWPHHKTPRPVLKTCKMLDSANRGLCQRSGWQSKLLQSAFSNVPSGERRGWGEVVGIIKIWGSFLSIQRPEGNSVHMSSFLLKDRTSPVECHQVPTALSIGMASSEVEVRSVLLQLPHMLSNHHLQGHLQGAGGH